MKLLERQAAKLRETAGSERGVIGYGIAWLLGVPLSVLVIIYLIFGH